MAGNLAKLIEILKEKKLDGLIVTNPVNIFYLTKFKGLSPSEREAILVIKRLNLDKGSTLTNYAATLITARLYQTEARLLASSKLKIKIVNERNQILTNIKNLLKNAKRVGFEQKNLTFDEYKEFKKRLNQTPIYSSSEARSYLKINNNSNGKFSLRSNNKSNLIPTKELIENLRAIKTADEIAKIEKAQEISQKAFEEIIKTIKVGQTEEEIASKLASIIKTLGGQGLAFESIIASGPNSGRPHYFTGDRRLSINDILLMDFGAKYQNYCADLSRTIFIGKAKDEHRNIFNHVLNAQKAAISKISHKSKSHEIHKVASEIFKDQKLHKYFTHGLGHGIGLDVHEKPHLRPLTQAGLVMNRQARLDTSQSEVLKENMVFSVEPGLYFPWGGVRIEDLVVLQNGKARVLGNLVDEIVEI